MPGRPENPIVGKGPIQALARQLRLLREHAGLTLRDLHVKTGYVPSTLSDAMAGRALPSWYVTEAIVRACGGNVEDWQERWQDAEELSQMPTQLRTTAPFQMPPRRRRSELPVAPRLVAGPPPLPLAANTAAEFAEYLLQVKVWAGDPPIRVLAARAEVPHTTLQDLLRTRRTTVPNFDTVAAFLAACGIEDNTVISEWWHVWRRLRLLDRSRGRHRDTPPEQSVPQQPSQP